MQPGIAIQIQSNTDVAAARRSALQLSYQAGMDESQSSNAGIVVTEAATNVLKHGGGGEILLHRNGKCLEIAALDKGPGAPNIARCFEDGFSTAGTAGNGLGAVSRLSAFRDLYTAPGAGTVLVAHVGGAAKHGVANIPFPGEQASGDSWAIQENEKRLRLMIVDGLGHGPAAAEAARAALEVFGTKESAKLDDLLEAVHARLRATRGAAASVADIAADGSTILFAGVGNVSGTVVVDAQTRRQMISVNGTLGHEVRKFQTWTYPAGSKSLVILHSDGVSASWSLEKYPGLFLRHPSVIAAVLFRDFRRTRDDATIVVVRVDGRV